VNRNGKDLVDARELHEALKSKQQFSDWIKEKVANSPDFIENKDYGIFTNIGEKRRGRPRKDYAYTLTLAKKVSMMENIL